MKRSIIRVLVIDAILLIIPLMAMQFAGEVNWSLLDFIFMGLFIFAGGMCVELVWMKLTSPILKVVLSVVIMAVMLVLWAEVAIGIFGTPFAGS